MHVLTPQTETVNTSQNGWDIPTNCFAVMCFCKNANVIVDETQKCMCRPSKLTGLRKMPGISTQKLTFDKGVYGLSMFCLSLGSTVNTHE